MSSPKVKDLKSLQAVWDKKLSDSGFEDIEDSEGRLKNWASSKYKYLQNNSFFSERKESLDVRRDYYRLAGFFLHDHVFANPVQKLIWEKHSQGMSLRNISVFLNEKNLDFKKDRISGIIKELVKEMMIYGRSLNE